jgi:protoheme IX farnesyltransferase
METASSYAAAPADFKQVARDYFLLTKPRVSLMVAFTGAAGALAAPGQMHPLLLALSVLAIALASGASGAFNMWYERRTDALMKRTASRPIPAGRVAPSSALAFSVFLGLFSLTLMPLAGNLAAAGLLFLSILSYCLLYTVILKPSTPQNIVIGGIAGALPPAIGWAAASGSMSWEPLLLVAIIFCWTPAHFWALAIVKKDDYRAAGIPMLPNVVGVPATIRHVMAYGAATILLGCAPALFLAKPAFYLAAAGGAGALYGRSLLRLWRSGSDKDSMLAFAHSILYLFAVFIALIAFS